MPILENFVFLHRQNFIIHLKLNVMKTFEEFEKALLSGEIVYVSYGRGVLFYFYAGRKCDVCGLVNVCVETVVVLDNFDSSVFRSCSVVPSVQAYYIYDKFSR